MGNASEWARTIRRALGSKRVNGSPAVGSIAWWDGVGALGSGGFGHVAYVEEIVGSTVYLSDSRWNTGSSRWKVARGSSAWPDGFLHIKDAPNKTSSSDNPRGHLDKAGSPAAGKVRVAGWAFDPNKKKTAVRIHVYVGGKSGAKGATGYDIGKAGKKRSDVSKAFPGVGAKHGFDKVFRTSKKGKQKVCAYAIDLGPGSNTALGCKTVEVRAEKAPDTGPESRGDSTGWYDPGPHGYHLRNSLSKGASNYIFPRGKDGSIPLVGDWDGDGRDSTGWYDPGPHGYHLRNSLSKGASNYIFPRGKDGSIPLVGDWDGDGRDSTGWYDPKDQSFHLRNSLSKGPSNYLFKRGRDDAIPVVGDWNGDGKDSTGVYYPWDQTWHLRNSLSSGPSNYIFKRGKPDTVPLVGNWDGK